MKTSRGKDKYSYWAYGLNIESEIEIPELVETCSGAADVFIRVRNSNGEPKTTPDGAAIYQRPGCVVRVSENIFCYDWKQFGRISVYQGREVVVEPLLGVEKNALSPFILGTVLAVILFQRGKLVLHASAVNINGTCVAFVGDKGAGKSTFAAYLQARGHSLISDDIVPVTVNQEMQVIPGYPRIRLWTDTVQYFGVNPEDLPRVASFMDKRTFECVENFSTESVKLNAIYILTESENLCFEKLPLRTAFIEIAKHTYFNRYLQATEQEVRHFAQCQQLINELPIFKLSRPRIYGLLPKVASEMEKHAAEISG